MGYGVQMGALIRARAAHKKSSTRRARSSGLPLSFIIARYFAYVLVAVGLAAVLVVVLFSLAISTAESNGTVYIASYADDHVGEVVAALESGQMEPAGTPSCYHWAVFSDVGVALASDMSEADSATAWKAVGDSPGVVHYGGLGGMQQQREVVLPDGNTCVLQYNFMPEFTSRAVRDALPNPQTLILLTYAALLVITIVLVAMRASRVISRKMQLLADVAAQIERQDLSFIVGSTNVREINEVLAAMERMRSALEESLHARWAADEARRRQVSALAHDLKTPLSVARWNADLLGETALDCDQVACAEGLSDSIDRMDTYVRLLVETSRSDVLVAPDGRMDVASLVEEVEQQARQLCEARGMKLDLSCSLVGELRGDKVQMARAVMNLVDNAAEYAPAESSIAVLFSEHEGALRIVVRDSGCGFSVAALAHGKERFFTGSAARESVSGHYGLGLSIVQDIVSAHGGTFEITNGEHGGACCTIEVPFVPSPTLCP